MQIPPPDGGRQERNMADKSSPGRRWEAYRPSKAIWFWSCVACAVATIVIGFAWGGWVTGGTAKRMAADADEAGRAQLAAAACVVRFDQGPDATAQLAALRKADSYDRGDMLSKNGWVTMPGDASPVSGAAEICVQRLLAAGQATATKG
jgi:hypothetical protein